MELNNFFYPSAFQTAVYHPPIADESDKNSKKCSRKNPWGNRSYADLITQAIETSPEKRLTLSQIYDWMIRNVPFFSDKGENNSSAGWKNSIRHNLSLHKKFHRIKNDGMGKSSWWTVNAAAGSGRIPRRKVPYRRRRGKALAVHQQLENLPKLFRNSRYGVQPKGLFQRNVWSGRTPWNTTKPVNESLQKIFQSNTSLNTVTSSTNHSKLLNSNISLVNAMCEKSCTPNIHLPPLNQNHSQNIFATQTLSLTETNSNGSFNSFKRSYLHEEYVFQQTSSNVVPSKTLSTEYFRSPHHLSGSYITEMGREQVNKVSEIIKNTVENNSFQFSTEQVSNTVPPQINDLSNEIDSLLCVNVQHDVSKFRSVLKELCSEINKCDSFNNEDCDSIMNQLVYKQNTIHSNVKAADILTNFHEINVADRAPLQLENVLGETISPKVSSARDIMIPEFQKTVPNNFHLSPKKVPSLYNNEVKSEHDSDILSFFGITTESPGSGCIEQIIEMLNSPKSEHTCSAEEVDEDNGCNFADNQSIFKQSLQLLKGRSENIQYSKNSQVEAFYDCNILLGSPPSEVTNTSLNIPKVNISSCTVNELEQNVNTADLMQFSDETAQMNSASDFSTCCTMAKIDEIIKKEEEKEPISLKEIDVASLLSKCKEIPESSLSVDLLPDICYSTRELPKILENESPILSINADSYDGSKTNNTIQNSNDDFLCDSSDLNEKAIKGQHAQVEFELKQNDMDLSTDFKVLQTLEELQKSDEQITANMFEDTDNQNFDNRASVVMLSGLNNKDLMEEKEMTDNYLMSHPIDLASNSNILADDLNMLIDMDFPFLFAETPSAFQNLDHSLSTKQLDDINNLSYNRKDTFDIEDSISFYLKSDAILDEFLNYVSLDAETDLSESNSSA